jgi:NADH:ubiquinone oxidoreductase subunit 3 (subunit A)
MEAPTIIVIGVILALLSAVSIILLNISSKEYPEKEEMKKPKFEAGKVSYPHCTDSTDAEKPKRKKKRYYNKKKKGTVANNATTEKRPVGRPRKTT